MQDWKQAIKAITQASNVNLFTHIHADGDCLGSAFALAYFLCDLGKKVNIICEEKPPVNLFFVYEAPLPKSICLHIWEETEKDALLNLGGELSVAVDVSDAKRLGERQELFFKAPLTMRIDHHPSTECFSDINLCSTQWAAAAEGIWEMVTSQPNWEKLTHIKEIAQNVYTGILTDTGCFAYSNVTATTHKIAGRIIEIAGNMAWQYSAIYENSSKAEIALKALAYNKVEYNDTGNVAFLQITQEEMAKTGATDDDLGGLAPFLRCIEGVSVGILVKPDKQPNDYRISLRSDEHCDVNAVASAFGGGGHKRASGLVYKAKNSIDFEDFKNRLIGEVEKWMV